MECFAVYVEKGGANCSVSRLCFYHTVQLLFIVATLTTKVVTRCCVYTQHVLLMTVDDWRAALDWDEIVGEILIDLSKAFNSIDHNLLVAYGVRNQEEEWFLSYLMDR